MESSYSSRQFRTFALASLAVFTATPVASVTCQGTQSLLAEDWKASRQLATQGQRLAIGTAGGLSWKEWSNAWMPLGMQVLADMGANLEDCPEGALIAVAHSLTAIDQDKDRSATKHLEVIKMMRVMLSQVMGQIPEMRRLSNDWSEHWLLATASLLNFVYEKWVTVPQDEKDSKLDDKPASELGVILPPQPQLRLHHNFLFRNYVDKFLASDVYRMEMTENSVKFTEAFAFAAFCHLHEVDLVLESGIYKGVSTEIWSFFVKDVYAIDVFIRKEAEDRLRKRPNVQLEEGDGHKLLPEILAKNPGRKAAVFIDGPKGELAIRLAMTLRGHPQVAFVAMHDMEPYRGELTKLGAFFYSDETWYQEAYGHLDEPFRKRPDLEAGGTMAFLE
eukprot:TRINITY_DN53868_c0_g1_i1.p1 TRINITY_DN53868_c0_g1~~TRINITY_DN53868_c0_g1_i1.p1  ORF type:complete len:404 (+),score=65.74 TRINITY_DN53868_c0_g1_i1:43-1212(+)